MPAESFSALGGALASIGAAAAEAAPLDEHTLGPIRGWGTERSSSCQGCGRRYAGADVAQIQRIHDLHVEDLRLTAERAECARTAPGGLAKARAALAAVREGDDR